MGIYYPVRWPRGDSGGTVLCGAGRGRREERSTMRLSAAARLVVKKRDETIKALKADLREARAHAARETKAKEKAERKNKRLEGENRSIKAENKKMKRKLRYLAGPSAPGVKNKADRKRDGEAKKKEREEAGGEGGKKRRPGAQKGHPANMRQYKVTRRVVIDEGDDRACRDEGCDGEREVTGYASKLMVEEKPRPDPDVVESQCPEWKCNKCGCRGITTRGKAVPIHMFRTRKGDAEPDRRAAEAENAGKQAPPAEAPRPAAGPAQGGAAEINWARLNDIPDSPDEPFYIQNPQRGVHGPNVVTRAISNWFYRLPIRKNQASLRADGISMSVGTVSKIITNAGTALEPVLLGNIELLRRAKMLHIDKTTYHVNGKRWNLWVFFDPQAKNVVYWLTRDKDGDALDRVLGDWDGIVICDGAPVFGRYSRIQRCWAHILRECHYLRRNNPGNERVRYVDDRLGTIFVDARAFRGSARARKKKRYEFARRVRALAREYGGDPALREFAVTLLNAAFDLFLFVVEPEVAPTNNPAEQLLREPVVVRKIRGSLRAERSAMVMCALLSSMTTWERQGLNPIIELKKRI